MQNSASMLVYLRPARLVFVRGVGVYETTIAETWRRLFHWLKECGLQNPVGRGYGLAHDNPAEVGASNCRYDACVAFSAEMELRASAQIGFSTLPGGPYACQRFSGSYDRIRKLVTNVHSDLVPSSDVTIDSSRPLVTIYLDNPDRLAEGDLRADICLPVMAAEHVEGRGAAVRARRSA